MMFIQTEGNAMCGRFLLTTPAQAVAEHFQLDEVPTLFPRYNIAPTQPVGVVRLGEDEPRLVWAKVRWGLVPAWARDPDVAARLINARSETVADKPSFRAAFRRRRCLVSADGFTSGRRPAAASSRTSSDRREEGNLRLRRPVGALARRLERPRVAQEPGVAVGLVVPDAVDSWLFLGLASQQLGQTGKARHCFAHFEDCLNKQSFAKWEDRLYWQLLEQEARSWMPRIDAER
jgi:hypothetical protein